MRQTTVLLLLAGAAPALAQTCTPDWTQYGHEGVSASVRAAAVFDFDGPGPQPPRLVIGGSFQRIGDRIARGIAVWNGQAWEPLSPELNASTVHDLAVFDEDGPGPIPPRLAAGGHFGIPGGYCGLAIYSGGAWTMSAVGQSVNDLAGFEAPVLAGSSLFAAGFGGAGRYQGGAFTPIVSAPFQVLECVEVYDPDGAGAAPASLYVGGRFAEMAGVPASGIARWDGTVWHALGAGVDQGDVWHLHVHDADGPGPQLPRLIVGGDFQAAGGLASPYVAAWDGAGWIGLPGQWGGVSAMTTMDLDAAGPQSPSLIISSSFGPHRWTGGSWTPIGNGLNHYTYALREFDEDGAGPAPARLIAGGHFTTTTSTPITAVPHIARLGGSAWSPMGAVANETTNDMVEGLIVHDEDGDGPAEPYLAVTGRFQIAGGQPRHHAAKWTGETFEPLGSLSTNGDALTSFDPDGPGPTAPWLIAGGWSSGIHRWTGGAWAPMPGVLFGFEALDFATFDSDGAGPIAETLYAVGSPSGVTAAVQRWDSTAWVGIPGFVNVDLRAAAAFDPDGGGPLPATLVVGGTINAPGIRNIAQWNGTAWGPLGTGTDRDVLALHVYDEDGAGPNPARLFAGGAFNTAGSAPARGIARWNGQAWSHVGAAPGFSINNFVRVGEFCTFDEDGPGPGRAVLVAAGAFATSLAVAQPSARGVAMWDGQAWSRLAEGHDGDAVAMAVFDDGGPAPALYLGGTFRNAGGEPSLHFARWGCPGTCYANCDLSTAAPVLNVADFTCFLQRFAGGEAYANCDGSTTAPSLNVADFTCFLQRFAAGCE